MSWSLVCLLQHISSLLVAEVLWVVWYMGVGVVWYMGAEIPGLWEREQWCCDTWQCQGDTRRPHWASRLLAPALWTLHDQCAPRIKEYRVKYPPGWNGKASGGWISVSPTIYILATWLLPTSWTPSAWRWRREWWFLISPNLSDYILYTIG